MSSIIDVTLTNIYIFHEYIEIEKDDNQSILILYEI